MRKVYGVVWNGQPAYVKKTLYTDEAEAQRVADASTNALHFLRRRFLSLKWYVKEFQIKEE